MTDANDHNGPVEQPPEVTRALAAVNRTRVTEAMFILAVAVAALLLVSTTAWNTYKIRTLTAQNVKAQDFGLRAVECILDNLSEHRWSNQVFHDQLGDFLHAARTPHTPLPSLPSDEEFASDCAPFNKGKTVVSTSTTSR